MIFAARFAFDGPVVVLPAREAAVLYQRLGIDELRRSVRGRDVGLDAVLLSWSAIAEQYIEQLRAAAAGSAVGIVESSTRGSSGAAEVGSQQVRKSPDDRPMTTTEAAVFADCTDRAVRLAAAEGRLRGVRDGRGRWLFDPNDVAAWAA